MSKSFKKIIVVSLFVIAFTIGWNACGGSDGIIALDNYPEAVLFCGEEYGVVLGTGTLIYDKAGNTMVVNEGHENDVEVLILQGLGGIMCTQYLMD